MMTQKRYSIRARLLERSQSQHADRRGMVLLIVMIVVVMISLAGFGFTALMFTENKAVSLRGDELQLEHVVASGRQLTTLFLDLPKASRDAAGGTYDNPSSFSGIAVDPDTESDRLARFSIVSPRLEDGEVTGLRFGTQDESTRLNLAVLPSWDEAAPGAGQRALMNLPGMSESVADALLDWVDADDIKRPLGAESDFYQGLKRPYSATNAAPKSIEELLLVRGVTRELLFGPDTNQNFFVDEVEVNRAQVQGFASPSTEGRPWCELLTVYSAEGNQDPHGRPRVNLNDDDGTRLKRSLSEVFLDEWVRYIIAYRQFGPYVGSLPAPTATETPSNNQPSSTAESADDVMEPLKFKVTSVLDLVDSHVRLSEDPQDTAATVLESPLRSDAETFRDDLPKLLDFVTVDQPVIPGRVNINQAPREVLRGVPGLDDSLIDQIIASRNLQTEHENTSMRHAAWLLAERLIDVTKMKALDPYITAGGDVHRAQIVAFFDEKSPITRFEVVVDSTFRPARQLYFRDLRLLGRGFPIDVLDVTSGRVRSRARATGASELRRR